MKIKYVLDTHALIWSVLSPERLGSKARRPSDVFSGALAYNAVLPTSLDAAIKAPVLGLPHPDHYDRLIVAEALTLGVPLITKDGNITDSGVVRVVW